MSTPGFADRPSKSHYDVVIIGGGIMGCSTAWFLTDNPDFDGSVLVLERDPTYEFASTTHTNSCIRQQFSTELNVRISQFGADFVQNLRERMGGDARVPDLRIQNFGYLYLADTEGYGLFSTGPANTVISVDLFPFSNSWYTDKAAETNKRIAVIKNGTSGNCFGFFAQNCEIQTVTPGNGDFTSVDPNLRAVETNPDTATTELERAKFRIFIG